MTNDMKKRGLGRGLDALFQGAREEEASFAPKIRRADEIVSAAISQPAAVPGVSQKKIAIEKLVPGKFQPRRHFNEDALKALSESIAVHGVLQPLLVRPLPNGMYEIIAGERRWRASQKARVHELPVVVVELDDNDTLEVALIENLQREDLTALEEAEGYQRLMDEFQHTQEVLAAHLGKSRSHVANMLRLLKLPAKVKQYMNDGKLTAGHARALVGVANAEEIASAIVSKGLNVRQTEKLVHDAATGKAKAKLKPKAFVAKDVDTMALEKKLADLLGMKVVIENETLSISYKTLDQLDDLIARLMRK